MKTLDIVLDSAEKQFAKNGYKSTSLDEIAKECQISKQGLLYYFPSKAELYDAVAKRLCTFMLQRIKKHSESSLPANYQLAEIFLSNVVQDSRLKYSSCILTRELLEAGDGVSDTKQKRYRRILDALEVLVVEAQHIGLLCHAPASVIVFHLLSSMQLFIVSMSAFKQLYSSCEFLSYVQNYQTSTKAFLQITEKE